MTIMTHITRRAAGALSALLECTPSTHRIDGADRIGGYLRVLASDLHWYAEHGSGRYAGGRIRYHRAAGA